MFPLANPLSSSRSLGWNWPSILSMVTKCGFSLTSAPIALPSENSLDPLDVFLRLRKSLVLFTTFAHAAMQGIMTPTAVSTMLVLDIRKCNEKEKS